LRRVLALSVLLIAAGAAAQTGYINELKGMVNDPDFNFTYDSDWRQHQIVNFVRNDHSQPLVVFWQAGGVTRPPENPLLPHKIDQNGSPCPENRLSSNLNTTIAYGLSDHTVRAGVYIVSQPRSNGSNASASTLEFKPEQQQQQAEAIPFSLVSDINTDIKGEPVRLQVVSQRIEDYIEYFFVFIQGKPTNFAMNLHYFSNNETGKPVQQDLMKYFGDAKISVEPDAAQTFKYDKLPLEQVPNFKAFSLIRSPMAKTFVKIPAKNVQVRRQLLFLLDKDRHILASGYVTLHVPA
jgi:hypothetical protein